MGEAFWIRLSSFFLHELIFRHAADRADPIVRQSFERCSRLYAVFWVAYFRIINIAADRAFPLFHLQITVFSGEILSVSLIETVPNKRLLKCGEMKMLSKKPIELQKIGGQLADMEVLRVAIIAELDAVSLYEQLAAATENGDLKKVLLDVAGEEKTHIGEFQALLLRLDAEQVKEMEKGKNEVEELTGK